jgi:transposase
MFFLGLHNLLDLNGKVLVLDNLAAHQNAELRQKLKSMGAILLFLPVATSFFNLIETIWAWVKYQWRNRLLDPTLESVDIDFLVQSMVEICDNIPGSIV